MQKITPYLWFEGNGEEALDYYANIFKDAKISKDGYYSDGMHLPKGTLLTATLEIFGQKFVILNAGPHHKFNDSISFSIACDDQEEVDYYWHALSKEGQEVQCGWLKDKYGVSWQIIPKRFMDLMKAATPNQAQKIMGAIMGMKKIIIADIEKAFS